MYEFDKKSNEIPIPFGYFSSKKEMDEFQKRDLLSKELILCVGNIYSNYHERIIKNSIKIHCIDIPMLSIDYNRLYMRAVNEYVGSYMNIDYPNILNFKNSNKNSTNQQYDYEYALREYRGAIVPLPTIVTEKSNIPICQNSSLGTVYFLNALIERFLTIFDTDKMNLRNRIMHGTDSLFNYFSINISAILMQLLWDIMDESIFIDSSCSNGCNPKKSKL